MPSSTTTLTTLRRFAATVFAISRRHVVESILVMLGASATEGIGLLLLVPLMQLVGVDAHQGPLTRVVELFASAFRALGLQPTLGLVLGVYVVVVAIHSLCQRQQTALSTMLEQEVVGALRTRVYRAIAGARWVHFAQGRSSDYAQALTDDIARVGTATYSIVDLSVGALTALVYIGLAFRVSPGMTGLVVLSGALLALAVRGQIASARRIGERYSASSARLYAAITEYFASMKLARSYGAEARHAAKFAQLSAELSDVGLTATRSYTALRFQLSIGSAAVLAAIVYVSYAMLAISTAQLLLLLFLFARLVPRLTNLFEKAQTLAGLLPAFASITDLERRCLAVAEPPVTRHLDLQLMRELAFERVTFDYRDDGESVAVRDASLMIRAGATTAIVGPSGAGKSTLADLMMGLLDPTAGTVLVDGQPLTRERLEAWRDGIGYVAQDPFLFHDTIRANLLWASPDAQEQDIWRALRLAAADTFVAALPHGLDTVVGDRGVLVSGGERQRLSLARALLRRPRLLILDEATSSLDSENEQRIQEAIEHLHKQMTIVIITHRLSTIRGADMIHVMENGRIVESGTWNGLTARTAGRFRQLCRAQGIDNRAPAGEATALEVNAG